MASTKGVGYLLKAGIEDIIVFPTFVSSQFKPGRFQLNGETFNYCRAYYNRSWNNERAVEIPIVKNILDRNKGKNILEVGNVLSHYFPVNHEVLDKYEKVLGGVISQDVVEFHPVKKYDLIISISTIEHVGWDETPREPLKAQAAIEHLRTLLLTGGKMVITIPVGYNPGLDVLARSGSIGFNREYYLRRVSYENRWEEVSRNDIQSVRYGNPFPGANGLLIGFIE